MHVTMKLSDKFIMDVIKEVMTKKLQSTDDFAKKVKEVSADEMADTLEKKIDMVKALRLEQRRLTKRLVEIEELCEKLESEG